MIAHLRSPLLSLAQAASSHWFLALSSEPPPFWRPLLDSDFCHKV
jgi:hypothetical protein